MRRPTRLPGQAAQAAGTVGAVLVLLLMLTVVINATSRLGFGRPLPGVIEYVGNWWMAGIVFLGLGLAAHRGEHIRIDLLERAHRSFVGRLLEYVPVLIVIAFLGLVAVAGWENAMIQMDRGEAGPVSGQPVWPARFVVPIGAVIYAFVMIFQALTSGRHDAEEADRKGPPE